MISVDYKLFLDGERKPFLQGTDKINNVLATYVQPVAHKDARIELERGFKVTHINRLKGFKIVLTHATKKCKVKKQKPSVFLRVSLEGKQTETQIKVAACNELKSSRGYHRTVCMVEANGLEYKVKCMHKGLTYTEAVYRCEIIGKKVL